MYSKDGYKRNSKDRNNPFNIIPSGNITMEDVDFPVFGIDDLGYSELMMPGVNYTFPGSEVFEIPLPQYQKAGAVRRLLSFFKPASNKFKSEINWGNWNKDIPLNKELMQEYNTIEEVAKKKGTWMKNPDGSPFEGPPELFVQMQSKAFKKAYPEGVTTTYRGFPVGQGPISWGKKYGDDYGAGRIINPMNVEYTSVFTGDKNLASHYGPNIFKLGSRNTPTRSLTIDAFGADWGDVGRAFRDKEKLQQSLNFQKGKLLEAEEGIKAGKQGNIYNKDFVTRTKKNIKSYENVLNNWDEITSNPAYKQLMDFAAGKQSLYTDDLAEFVEKYNLDNLFVKNIDDGVLGDILISNQVPGNFLKSLEGNVGTFDLTDPNIYKEEGGDLPKAQLGWLRRFLTPAVKKVDDVVDITKVDDIIDPLNIREMPPGLNLPQPKDWLFRRHTNVDDIMEPMEFPGNVIRAGVPVPTKISWFTPSSTAYSDVGSMTFQGNIVPKNPLYLNKNQIYSEEFMKDVMNKGHDAIIVRGRIDNKGPLVDDIRYAKEVIPLYKDLIKNLERIREYGGSLPKFQNAGEYDEDGYKTVTYGANKKKYQDTGDWSEYEPYETYSGKTYRRRTYELSRDDLRYLEYKKGFLRDVNYGTGKNNTPRNLTQFIRNSNKAWRVQEIVKDNGAVKYLLQYPTQTGFRTFASGDANSGLANLDPEYVQGLKKTGKKGITQFSSWFDMTPQERKDYGYSEWFDKGFTRDLKIDQDGNTKSGWNYYNERTPLTYTLSDVEIRKLPRSIVNKYNLVGNDKLKLDPKSGEIYMVNQSGSFRNVINQKDMKWFQNPGRLKQLATDSKFNYKEDNILDYLNNPDFRYFADSQKVTLDPVKLDGVPSENDMSLQKPRPYESTVTLEPKTLDQIETEREDEIIKRRPYEAPVTLDPVEFKGFSDKEQEIIKSNPYESAITLDKKEIEEIPVDEGSLIERRMQETPITLDPINVTGIDSDGTVTTDGSKQRFVPKPDIEADMPDIVLTPEMEEERDKAKTIEDIMGNLQDVRGTTKYVNKSAKAILDAINRDDYTEKDLSRDLGIFEKYYGQENLGYLKDMLDKTQGPKANKGIEVLEDGKFDVKMNRLNSIIDKYDADQDLSPAEMELLESYGLISKTEPEVEEVKETDLVIDNKKFSLDDQIYIYNQYLDSAFTSDDEEKSGNKIVDKINRVYYNQAKQKDMHVYDLLLAMQNEMRQ